MGARCAWLLAGSLLVAPADAAAQDRCIAGSAELLRAVNEATSAFSAMDRELFQSARDEARRALTCVTEPLSPAQAAAYHRMEALAAFFDQDKPWGMASFRAALSIQPAYELGESLAPAGSPVDLWYQEAQQFPPISMDELQAPERCSLLLDGATEAERQVELPVIAQVLEWDGTVRWSGLLQPSELIPEDAFSDEFEPVWPPAPVLTPQPEPLPPAPYKRVSPLWFGASGAALAAGGLYAAAWASRSSWQEQMDACEAGQCWDDPQGAWDESEATRRRTNALTIASAGTGVLALGLGVGVAFSIDW